MGGKDVSYQKHGAKRGLYQQAIFFHRVNPMCESNWKLKQLSANQTYFENKVLSIFKNGSNLFVFTLTTALHFVALFFTFPCLPQLLL